MSDDLQLAGDRAIILATLRARTGESTTTQVAIDANLDFLRASRALCSLHDTGHVGYDGTQERWLHDRIRMART